MIAARADRHFYFFDPRYDSFVPTTETKLQTLLSQYLIQCASDMGRDVEVKNLFVELRSDAQLKQIVKKARSMLATGPGFFIGKKAHKRVLSGMVIDPAATPSYELFVREALEKRDNVILTVSNAYDNFTRFCVVLGDGEARK